MTTRLGTAGFLSVVAFASIAWGQTDATVSGTVTDPSGARVASATVTARNAATGAATPVPTNDAGAYTMPALPPGTYTFTAEHPGFRKEAIEGVVLEVGTFLTLNLGLELGQATETVEVQATATEVNATSSSVGNVVDGKRLIDLPLVGRSAFDLMITQPGVQGSGATNFYLNGNQGGAVNYTMDGITSMDQIHQNTFYLYTNVVSVDRAEEFRVVTSPADAEYGRGSGQVQMVTRAGSNKFVGSVYWEVYNGDFNANTWFNNAAGRDANGNIEDQRPQLKRNNYGIRFGGPVELPGYHGRNKTFFNGIYEPYKSRNFTTVNNLVYTPTALQGIFRYYSGFQDQNYTQANPTANSAGQPVAPAGCAAPCNLQSVSVLGRDPNRLGVDPTGAISHLLSYLPLPNNYRVGDGLNTAGYTWNQPTPVNFELYEGRIDHIFNDKNRIAITLSQQSFHSFNVAAPPPFPLVPGQADPTETTSYSVALTSILRPNLINEMRIGVFRPRTTVQTPYDPDTPGSKGLLPIIDGTQSILIPSANITAPFAGVPGNYIGPTYQYGDDLTWIKGRHSFKGGFQARLISSAGFAASDSPATIPSVSIGAPATAPVTNISTGTNAIPGLTGTSITTATNLLEDLTGSVISAKGVNISPGGTNPVFLPGQEPYHEWHQNEYDLYFKDDYKIKPSLTLNLGARYEVYPAPYEAQGKGVAPVGGGGAVFGISGTTFGSLFTPGASGGSQTVIEGIGPGAKNPNTTFYNTDWKNISPNLGLAWALPSDGKWKWLSGGKDRTTFRLGYGIGYQRVPIGLINTISGAEPGLTETDTALQYTNLSNVVIPVPPAGVPLSPVPLTGTGSHTQTLYAYNQNLRTPYSQNFNATLTRALTSTVVMSVGYVGSKGSELVDTVNTNEVNIVENGLLNAFKTVQAGGDSPLIDQIFSNSYAAVAAAGSGSNYVRTNSATNTFLANSNPGGFANYISTTNALSGTIGGLLLNAKLPLNFVVANPQFLNTDLVGNFGNSTYHSLQATVTKRFSSGFSLQSSYVWSHSLGTGTGDVATFANDFRTLRDEHLDKQPLSFDYQSVFKLNGIYELPFGRGKPLGRNMNRFVDRIVGGWQAGAVALVYSGAPLTFTGQNGFNTSSAGSTPILLGALPADGVDKIGSGVTYFNGLTQITDPLVATLGTSALQSLSALKAIATSSGVPLLVNATPGVVGSLGFGVARSPGAKSLNVNLIKHIRINERFNAEIRASANNVTNTPIFGAPTVGINSSSFGKITTATGNRVLVLQARVNF